MRFTTFRETDKFEKSDKSLKILDIDGIQYTIEDLKIVRYKRQTVVPNHMMLNGMVGESRSYSSPQRMSSPMINIQPRPSGLKVVDTFKYGGRMRNTKEEKDSIIAQLLDNYVTGQDLFEKPGSAKINNPNQSFVMSSLNGSSKIIEFNGVENQVDNSDIERDFDINLYESPSPDASNKSIPGLHSLTTLGGRKKFLMLDKGSQHKKNAKALQSFLVALKPINFKLHELEDWDLALVNFFKTGHRHLFYIEGM